MNAPTLHDVSARANSIDNRSVIAAWLAFVAALAVDWTEEGMPAFVLAAGAGAFLALVGFAAASTCRAVPQRSNGERGKLALGSVAAGVALGLINLSANWAITAPDPALRAALVERMQAVPPVAAVVAAPITEEIVFRLFVMGVAAWLVYRLTKRTELAFVVALVASTIAFALPHLIRPLPEHHTLATYYRWALLAKYAALGVPLGWIFWRWGLPFAILCHAAANATHLLLQWNVF